MDLSPDDVKNMLNYWRIVSFVFNIPTLVFFIALSGWMLLSKHRRLLIDLIITSCLICLNLIADVVGFELFYYYAKTNF